MLEKEIFHKKSKLCSYTARVWRMVETQETAATLNIVDTMEEQALLEALLESVKPPYREGTEGRHYLIKTAFRYPPLKHGSRFGSRLMPSFFYASEKPVTSLAETAYYRFLFLHDMQEPYQKEIDSLHTLFCVAVNAELCLDLLSKPYSDLTEKLTDRVNYSYCQAVGEWAVNQRDVQLIRALSARHPSHCNVAIADPKAILSREPAQLQSWLCRTTMNKISFSSRQAAEPQTFYIEDFCVDGQLPRPA